MQGPPQSLPVSCPLAMPSEQLATWHLPFWQTLLWQSVAVVQAYPSAHGLQLPPQSLSVSVPLRIWSEQLAAAQIPPTQWLDSHEIESVQVRPAMHRAQMPAASPQSTSDSPPFALPSWQVGGTQLLPSQLRLAQSATTLQAAPSPQPAHDPPQSTSVSVPSCFWSKH